MCLEKLEISFEIHEHLFIYLGDRSKKGVGVSVDKVKIPTPTRTPSPSRSVMRRQIYVEP